MDPHGHLFLVAHDLGRDRIHRIPERGGAPGEPPNQPDANREGEHRERPTGDGERPVGDGERAVGDVWGNTGRRRRRRRNRRMRRRQGTHPREHSNGQLLRNRGGGAGGAAAAAHSRRSLGLGFGVSGSEVCVAMGYGDPG
jgi:hypothetical protein